jgi:hypothetical protein
MLEARDKHLSTKRLENLGGAPVKQKPFDKRIYRVQWNFHNIIVLEVFL